MCARHENRPFSQEASFRAARSRGPNASGRGLGTNCALPGHAGDARFSGPAPACAGKPCPSGRGFGTSAHARPHRKPCAPNRGFGRNCALPGHAGDARFSGPAPACAGKPCPSDRGFGTSAHARPHRKPCAPNRGFGRKCALPGHAGDAAFFRPRAQSCGNAVPFHRGNRARPRVCTETPALPTGAFERNCTRCPSTRETRALQPPRPAMQESRHIFARPACIRGKERPPSPLRPAGGEGRSPSIRTFASHENRRRSGGARRSACAARRGWYTPSPPPAPQSRRWCSERREIPPERESTRWG